jgi:HEAT repeat protein
VTDPLKATIAALRAAAASDDEGRAEAAALALAGAGEAGLKALQALLRDPSAELRWWAVRGLAASTHPQAPHLLAGALRDPDQEVQKCAALGLRLRPTPQAIPDLIQQLQGKDRLLARLAGDALSAIGAQAIPALAKVLQSPDPAARSAAARALAHIDSPDIIEPLMRAVDDPSPYVRHWVEEGLGRMGLGMVFFKP